MSQGKKQVAKFMPVDYGQGEYVKCDSDSINLVLQYSKEIEDDYQYMIRSKKLENIEKLLPRLMSDGSP